MENKKENDGGKVYVGNLPLSLDENDLREIFGSYGEILKSKIEQNKYYNNSRGFGSVTFSSKTEAKKAIEEMNGEEFQGRKLAVSFFEEKKQQSRT